MGVLPLWKRSSILILFVLVGGWLAARPSLLAQTDQGNVGRVWVPIQAIPGFESSDLQCALVRPGDDGMLLVDHVGGLVHEVTATGSYVGVLPSTPNPSDRLASCAYAGWTGGSFWIYDPMRARVRLTPVDGPGLPHEVPVRLPRLPGTGPGLPRGADETSDEWIVAYAPPDPARLPFGPMQLPITVGGLTAPPSRELARLEYRQRTLVFRTSRFTTYVSFQPFGDDPLVSVSSMGGLVAVLERPGVGFSDSGPRVTVRDTHKELARWTLPSPHRPLPDVVVQDYVAAKAAELARSGRLGDSVSLGRWLALNVYVPAAAPAVDGLVAGRDSTIWIRTFRMSPTADQQWSAYTIRGVVVGRATAPPALVPIEGTRAALWGIVRGGHGGVGVVRLPAGAVR